MHRKTIIVSLMGLSLLASTAAFAASSDKAEVKGMIISRTGETLIVRTSQGNVTVVLTDNTTTKDDRGLFGLEKQQLSDVVLIPGLKVDVDGTSGDNGRVVAKTITVDGDDLETAEMIQSGLHPTAEQVAANMQAIAANKQNIETHGQNFAANQQNIAANRQNIEINQQNVAANKQQIEENTQRFTALSE